ncbi:uncharacterized protein LOC117643577 [Thrips palmi]|uniref:Uncharacterized protein LOC117643577 n=1 Tax=Thrips palmi TaxID=161013 RepID=A0A6P8ZL88_THRPL|nr:uncharacterized protein LOC117643577 [Thrips palmi]
MQDESRKELRAPAQQASQAPAVPAANMVDLAGYVIILVQTQDGKIKLYGSPAEKNDLEIGDEILEVNGRILETCSHEEILTFLHECIKSRVICLRVKRRTSARVAAELAHSVQDAFVIAVEQQARERLERLSQLKRIKPVDMNKLCDQVFYGRFTIDGNRVHLSERLSRPGSPSRPGPSRESSQSKEQWNGIIDHKSVFVTSLGPAGPASSAAPPTSGSADPSASGKPSSAGAASQQHAPRLTNGHGAPSGTSTTGAESGSGLGASFEEVELKQDLDADDGGSPTNAASATGASGASPELHQQRQNAQQPTRSLQDRRASSPFTNGRTELLIPANTAGSLDQDGHGHRMRTTALVEPGADEAWSVR